MMQSPKGILMVRPKHFGFDEETVTSNHFQNRLDKDPQEIQKLALKEFDEAVRKIRDGGVHVRVFDDRDDPVCPDSIFPNNWISSHSCGLTIVYPMEGPSRRKEKRDDIIAYFEDSCRGTKKTFELLDLSHKADEGLYLEGTGSIVFDYLARRAFACRSSRTDERVLRQVCDKLDYEPVIFRARDSRGLDVYHTNVVMWIGTKVAAVCMEAIADVKDRMIISNLLQSSGRVLIPISLDQMENFIGNCYEVMTDSYPVLIMSHRARGSLSDDIYGTLTSFYKTIVVCDVSTIETVGGGSIRCMMAGNFML